MQQVRKSLRLKERFYEELEQLFEHFRKYHMKILLGDFNAKVGRKTILNWTFRNENLRRDSNKNRVKIMNFATSEKICLLRARYSRTETFIRAPDLS